MKDIVLCATQRCGSTMVIEDMRNTGVMGMPEEWFVPWDPEKSNENWSNSFQSVRKRATGENGVMAIKVMANQLYKVDGCLSTFIDTDAEGIYPHFVAAFSGAAWIKITRRDVVSQAISRVMSRQTGINHATANEDDEHFAGNLKTGLKSNYNQNTKYKYGAILREVASISLENLAWERFFVTNNISATEIFYEDIADDDGMIHLDIIAGQAKIDSTFVRTERKLVKMANEKNRLWHNRFFKDAASKNFRTRNT